MDGAVVLKSRQEQSPSEECVRERRYGREKEQETREFSQRIAESFNVLNYNFTERLPALALKHNLYMLCSFLVPLFLNMHKNTQTHTPTLNALTMSCCAFFFLSSSFSFFPAFAFLRFVFCAPGAQTCRNMSRTKAAVPTMTTRCLQLPTAQATSPTPLPQQQHQPRRQWDRHRSAEVQRDRRTPPPATRCQTR